MSTRCVTSACIAASGSAPTLDSARARADADRDPGGALRRRPGRRARGARPGHHRPGNWPSRPASPPSSSTTCGTSRRSSCARPRRPRPVHHRGDPVHAGPAGGGGRVVARRAPPRPGRALGDRRLSRLARVRLADRRPLRRPPLDAGVRHRRGRSPTTRPRRTLGPTWAWRDEIYLFRSLHPGARVLLRLADGQVDLSAPGGRVPECGFPLAWCHGDEKGRTFYSALGPLSPGLGEHRSSCATWPGASPGCRRRLTSCDPVADLPPAMAAAVYQSPGVVTVEDRPVPRPGAGQVLVRVRHCGICGSDIHQLRDGWGFKPGAVAGHEWSRDHRRRGRRRRRTGRSANGSSAGSSPKCGTCRRCREGKPSQCENRSSLITDSGDGAFAEFVLVRAAGVLRLPEGLSARHAALAEPLAVALHGITRSGIAPGDTRHGHRRRAHRRADRGRAAGHGCRPASRWSSRRRAGRRLARDVGATEVIDPSDLEIFSPREPERISGRAVHVVLECSGKKEAVEAGFCQLRRGGVLVMVGAGIEHPTFDSNRMILNELTCAGRSSTTSAASSGRSSLLSSGALPNDLFIDPDDVPLHGVADALEALGDRPHRRQGHGRAGGAHTVSVTRPGHDRDRHAPLLPVGPPRFNHVALSLPADLLGEREPGGHLPLLRPGPRLHGAAHHDRGPSPAGPQLRPVGPVHLSHCRGRPHAVPPHGPLRVLGGIARGAAGHRGPGQGLRRVRRAARA